MKDKGYIQVYTGNGKGKTTASLGLTLRAYGAGYKVYIGQFIKSMKYSEVKALAKFSDRVIIEQFGRGCFIKNDPTEEDIRIAQDAFVKISNILMSGEYDIVILEEINVAIYFGLVSEEQVLKLLNSKPENTEVVLTGRYATEAIKERADLVTEMTEVKHYYKEGVEAREGIER